MNHDPYFDEHEGIAEFAKPKSLNVLVLLFIMIPIAVYLYFRENKIARELLIIVMGSIAMSFVLAFTLMFLLL